MLPRSGDIRGQSRKWSKIDRNFACFWPQIFWGERPPSPLPPNFWSGIIKYSQSPTMWQSFRAIGRGSSEKPWRKYNERKIHHGKTISPSGTTVPGGLTNAHVYAYEDDVSVLLNHPVFCYKYVDRISVSRSSDLGMSDVTRR